MSISVARVPAFLAVLSIAVANACSDGGGTQPVLPGPPAKLELTAGDAQSALAGTALASPLSVTVRDAKGMAVPNALVKFAVVLGGGSLTPTTVTTDAKGVAGGVTWTLGTKGGDQAATARVDTVIKQFAATTRSGYSLTLRFFGPTMSTEAQSAFTNAANRIRAAIVQPISNVPLSGANLADCKVNGLTGTLQESTTGVIIYAAVAPIDGVGKTLAMAFPCFVRNSNSLPAVGVMQFDQADIQSYINSGLFESVVLHEMNHVMGFGTIWGDRGLLQNPAYRSVTDTTFELTGSTNPRFTGPAAIASCASAGGTANHCTTTVGVAVEQCGLEGTADGHWREVFTDACTGTDRRPVGGTPAFDTELMTGYAETTPNMPWSAMTISSLQDLGYTVNLLAADAYTVPSLLTMARMSLQAPSSLADPHSEDVRRPRFTISTDGRVQAIIRRPR